MNGYKNNEEYHISVAITLFISLCLKANVAGNLAGLYNYHVYELSSLVISDKFCTSNLKFNQISIYLTNFSNFISHFRPRSKQVSGKHDVDLKLPDGVNREIYHVNLSNRCKCMLSQRHYLRNISGLNHRFLGFQDTYLIELKGNNFNITDVNNYINMVPKWFSLLVGQDETDYRSVAMNGSHPFNFMHTQKLSTYQNHNYNFTRHIRMNQFSDFLCNILSSLKGWIKLYPKLSSIFINLNLKNDSTDDQKLQNICVDFQMIYDHFYATSKSSRDKVLFKKINYVLSRMDKYLLNYYIKQFNIKEITRMVGKKGHKHWVTYSKQEVFADKIKKFRNGLSHDTSDSFLRSDPNKKAQFLNALRNLVRCWMLRRIGIKEKYIKGIC